MMLLFTTCTVCLLFILWRRADSWRTVVSHQLKTWTGQEGRVRLSGDDGPAAREFLDDDYQEDNVEIPRDAIPDAPNGGDGEEEAAATPRTRTAEGSKV